MQLNQMKNFNFFISLGILFFCSNVIGQDVRSTSQNSFDSKINQIQNEINISKIQNQTERLRIQSELLELQARQNDIANQSVKREKTAWEIIAEYQEKKAAEEAQEKQKSDFEDQVKRLSAHSSNNVYLVIFCSGIILASILFARKLKVGKRSINYEEKFGVVLMASSLLLSLIFISISDYWRPDLDIIQNLMISLEINAINVSENYSPDYLIHFKTKYLILIFIAVALYGFTTYIGVTPAWKKSIKKSM